MEKPETNRLETTDMTRQTAADRNDFRCLASEIICKLYEAKDVSQLKLLKAHCDRALEELAAKPDGEIE
jgi:hypothetical protein